MLRQKCSYRKKIETRKTEKEKNKIKVCNLTKRGKS